MTLDEAFAAVEHLPARERLLLGRLGAEEMAWSSSHIDLLDLLDDIDPESEFGAGISQAIDEFRFGDAVMGVLVTHTKDNSHLILAMGPESHDEVAECLSRALKEVLGRQAH